MISSTQMIFFVFAFLLHMKLAASSSSQTSDNLDFVGFHEKTKMPYKASDMVAVTFPSSTFSDDEGARIYLTGGCAKDQVCTVTNVTTNALSCYCPEVNNDLSYYSPRDSTWHTCSSMLRQRYRHMATKIGNYLYVIGGRDVNDNLITAIDRYNVLNDTWEFVVDWKNATSDGVAWSIERENLLMIAGGYDAIYATEGILTTYNVISGVFDTNYPKMNVGRGDTQVAHINEDEFYVIGGWTGDNFITPSDVVEKYSYTKNTWTQVKSLHYGRGDLACGVLAGTIFAIGGETRPASDISHTHSVPVKVVERYLPWNDSWVFEESIPDNVFRFIGASWNSSLNIYTSSIFLFGGQGTFNNISDIFPVKNTTIQYIPQSTVQSSSSSKQLPPESIAGIVIGVVVGVGAIIFIIVIYFTRKHFLYVSLKEEEPSLPRAFDAVMIGGEGDKKQAETLHYLEQEELRDAFPSYHNDQKNKNQSKAVVRYDEEAVL
mmetsp:Transcript_24498/g.26797  ORF Transcript_24498/g.26797 Transcript_24498/m.26797 type:complete len:489 (-) Transcript_24498:178-1644(-)